MFHPQYLQQQFGTDQHTWYIPTNNQGFTHCRGQMKTARGSNSNGLRVRGEVTPMGVVEAVACPTGRITFVSNKFYSFRLEQYKFIYSTFCQTEIKVNNHLLKHWQYRQYEP